MPSESNFTSQQSHHVLFRTTHAFKLKKLSVNMLITSQLPQEYANKSMKMHANGKKLSCVLSRSQLVVTVPMFPTKEKCPRSSVFFGAPSDIWTSTAWRMQPCMLPWKLTAARPWKMMLFQDHFPFEEMVPLKRGYVNFRGGTLKSSIAYVTLPKTNKFTPENRASTMNVPFGAFAVRFQEGIRVYEHSKPCYPLVN